MEQESNDKANGTSTQRKYPFDGSELIQLGNYFKEMGRKLKEAGLDYKWVKKDERKALIRKIDDFLEEFEELWGLIKKKMERDIDLYTDDSGRIF